MHTRRRLLCCCAMAAARQPLSRSMQGQQHRYARISSTRELRCNRVGGAQLARPSLALAARQQPVSGCHRAARTGHDYLAYRSSHPLRCSLAYSHPAAVPATQASMLRSPPSCALLAASCEHRAYPGSNHCVVAVGDAGASSFPYPIIAKPDSCRRCCLWCAPGQRCFLVLHRLQQQQQPASLAAATGCCLWPRGAEQHLGRWPSTAPPAPAPAAPARPTAAHHPFLRSMLSSLMRCLFL